MATLHVRNVPDELYETLRERAEKEGRSIGGQTVALLEEALAAKEREARIVRRRFRRLPRRDLKPGERLGAGARRVLAAAQQEARTLEHGHIGTEHLLLGLLHERNGPAARALQALGLELEATRREIADDIGQGEGSPAGPFPFSARAKKVLELALREALEARQDLMEPQHVLVAIVREGEGPAAKLLAARGADVAALRGLTAYASADVPFASAQVAAQSLPTSWEYHVAALEGDAADWTRRLNELAGDGWELESVQRDRAVFRRRA